MLLYCLSCLLVSMHNTFLHGDVALADDAKALGSTIFAVADSIRTPLDWKVGPLLAQAISTASVSKPVQLQAFGQAIALASNQNLSILNNDFASPEQRASNIAQIAEGFESGFNDNFDMAVIIAALQPQVQRGVFTFEQVFIQVMRLSQLFRSQTICMCVMLMQHVTVCSAGHIANGCLQRSIYKKCFFHDYMQACKLLHRHLHGLNRCIRMLKH